MPSERTDTSLEPAARMMREALSSLTRGPVIDFLGERMRVVDLPRDAQLLRAGDVCEKVWLIAEGAVRMCWYRDGREHIGDFHLEGEFLSDYSSFVTGVPTRLHLLTTEPSRVCVLSKSDFMVAEQAFPLEVNRALRHVAEGLTVTFANRIWSTLMDSPTDRYLALREQRPAWFTRFPQYMIASYLGLTPEGLSKLRKRLDVEASAARPSR